MSATGMLAMRELETRNPLQLEDFLGSGDSEEARAQLQRILAADPETASTFSQHDAQPRYVRRALVAAGVAVSVGAAAVAITVLPGVPGTQASAAASVLKHEAQVAAHQASTALPSGDYLYTKSVNLALATFGYGNPGRASLPGATTSGPSESFNVVRQVTRQVWSAADGSGRIVEQFGPPSFPTGADRAAWLADGSPSLLPDGGTIDKMQAPGGLTVADLAGLPTDPAALGSEIAQRTVIDGPPGEAETFKIIGELLSETDASPALRSALYRVAAGLPGVSLVGTATDALGRTGTAVSYSAAGETHQLIFDVQTSRLLATKDIVTDPSQAGLSVPAGTVIGATTYVVSEPVSSTSAIATPDQSRGR